MASRGGTSVCKDVCVSVCVSAIVCACVLLQGIFLHFTHAFPPKGMWHCRGKKKRIKVILSVCSSSPESLPSRLYAHTHTRVHTHIPTSSSFRLVSSSAGGYVRYLTTESGESGCHACCKKSYRPHVCLLSSHTLNQQRDDSASSECSFIYESNFCTNKCAHCETRQINSD